MAHGGIADYALLFRDILDKSIKMNTMLVEANHRCVAVVIF